MSTEAKMLVEATSERNICQVSIHPLVQQMFKETHSLLVTVLGTGDTTMNKVDKVSVLRGWWKHYTQHELS